ncbi:MAG TPA: hypothetical protein V6C93_35325 [Allocoleopsis sp.]
MTKEEGKGENWIEMCAGLLTPRRVDNSDRVPQHPRRQHQPNYSANKLRQEAGCCSNAVTTLAETIKIAKLAASMKYSG